MTDVVQMFSGRTIKGRADLVRALSSPELTQQVAMQLGLRYRPPKVEPKPVTAEPVSFDAKPAPEKPTPVSTGYPKTAEPMALWLPTHYQWIAEDVPEAPEGERYIRWDERPEPASYRPLVEFSTVRDRLRRALGTLQQQTRIDLDRLVQKVARAEVLQHLPRLRRKRWHDQIVVVQDRSTRLIPFDFDQQQVIHGLKQMYGAENVRLLVGRHPDFLRDRSRTAEQSASDSFDNPPAGSLVLVLGDLGTLARRPIAKQVWNRWGRTQKRRGCELLALVPCSVAQVSKSLRNTFAVESWQREAGSWIRDADHRDQLLQELLVLAAPALRIEPGLLRDLRQVLGCRDASLESDFWMSSQLQSNHPDAATLEREMEPSGAEPREPLRSLFEQKSPELRERVLACLRDWHAGLVEAPEVWFLELINLSDESRKLVSEQDLKNARSAIRRIAIENATSNDARIKDASNAFLSRQTRSMTEYASGDEEVGPLLVKARDRLHPSLSTPKPIRFRMGDRSLQAVPESAALRHATGLIHGTTGEVQVRTSGSSDGFWETPPPAGVARWGTDKYGPWFEFDVDTDDGPTISQRMRWIPAGTFLMGSPESEPERHADREQQHEVTLTRGYWLADTTCTQRLWQAVVGRNPSNFKGADLPVEKVSYQDVVQFLTSLNSHVQDLNLALPSEAQWEYACRAGTTTPFHTGNQLTTDQANYDGDFPYNNGPKGEDRRKTVPVTSFEPNDWGLYQMHGNVWEWCQDWYDGYSPQAIQDPNGPQEGSSRVVRGGSWLYDARSVRSAFRDWYTRVNRYYDLGFRCLSSGHAEPAVGAEVSVAEQDPQRPGVGGAEKVSATNALTISVTAESDREDDGGSQTSPPLPAASSRIISTDLEQLTVTRIERPDWASDFGRDRLGVFADFEIDGEDQPIRQRLRYIPPGRFRMGSPKSEAGRYEREVLHDVIISQAFWMFDTPCTQQLWKAVMGANPSQFWDPARPVEQVNWQQANDFSAALTARIRECTRLKLYFALPTEAQWEYACRGGKKSATYAGDLEIIGDANAPVLDDIGWYGGNCGHSLDIAVGRQMPSFDKQYEFDKGSTRRVKLKQPNDWGLYDMLGNVFEWCHDFYSEYDREVADPIGPRTGSYRVVRGGGWLSYARYLRSAFRDWSPSDHRSNDLSFRCLSPASSSSAEQVSAESTKPRNEAAAKQRTP